MTSWDWFPSGQLLFDCARTTSLRRYPLIKLREDSIVPAFPLYLVDRVTRGVLEEILEAHADVPGERDRVGNFFGDLFQTHIRHYFDEAKNDERDSWGCRGVRAA